MSATPGWPRRIPGGLGIWLDRMRAYVDRSGSTAPGVPVALVPIAPALAVPAYPTALVPEGGGRVGLTGAVRIDTDLGGERRILSPPDRYLPAQVETHPVAATVTGGASPGIVPMLLNAIPAADGGGLFLIYPEIPADAFALVWLDAVSYWPAGD